MVCVWCDNSSLDSIFLYMKWMSCHNNIISFLRLHMMQSLTNSIKYYAVSFATGNVMKFPYKWRFDRKWQWWWTIAECWWNERVHQADEIITTGTWCIVKFVSSDISNPLKCDEKDIDKKTSSMSINQNNRAKTKLAFYRLVPFDVSLRRLRRFAARFTYVTLIFIVARHSRNAEEGRVVFGTPLFRFPGGVLGSGTRFLWSLSRVRQLWYFQTSFNGRSSLGTGAHVNGNLRGSLCLECWMSMGQGFRMFGRHWRWLGMRWAFLFPFWY